MAEFNPLTADATLKSLAQSEEQNPLKKYFRQPKVHITLPSKGKYYPGFRAESHIQVKVSRLQLSEHKRRF